jgi:hypothetical protein
MVACVHIPRVSLRVAAGRLWQPDRPPALAPPAGSRQVLGETSRPAEALGVEAGMPIGEALARCPSLLLITPDPARTTEIRERILCRLEVIGAAVESARPGEAFFATGSVRSTQPAARGRGSSVNSVLCHLLGLSHVDPIACSLYPGRFLSAEATSMPDIDIDLAHDIRDAVIPAVIERRGPEHAALVAASSTYRPRGAVRDLGGALGLPAAEVDRVACALGSHGGDDLGRVVADAVGSERAASPRWRHLVELCGEALACPATPPSIPAGWSSRPGRSPTSAPSCRPGCRTARSCSGTRTASTTRGC